MKSAMLPCTRRATPEGLVAVRPLTWLPAAMLAATPLAQASPAEVFGFGSRGAAQAGAVSATVDDFAAGYYNPAGLAFGAGKRVTFGFLGAASNLKVNERRTSIEEPFGMILGATAPAPLGGALKDRLHVGV